MRHITRPRTDMGVTPKDSVGTHSLHHLHKCEAPKIFHNESNDDLVRQIIASNKALSAAVENGVLISYNLIGIARRARIGARVNIEMSEAFGPEEAMDVLDKTVTNIKRRVSPFLELLRGGIHRQIVTEAPGIMQVQFMDACGDSYRGQLYDILPSRLLHKAWLTAILRDDFIKKARKQGAKILE